MLLENHLYSGVYYHLKEFNKLIEKNNFSVLHKTYDTQKGDYVNFIFFDIKSLIKSENNIILKEIKYYGNLKISYYKPTNEVMILELPKIVIGNEEISVFTSDIASILVKTLKKYISEKDINLNFINQFSLIAIDDKTLEIIPSIKYTRNCILLENISQKISKEIKMVLDDTKKYQAKKEREYNAKERAVAKKRSLFGLDPVTFLNKTEFKKTLESKVVEMCEKKLSNLIRHLESNKIKYIELLQKFDISFILDNSPDKNEYYCNLSLDQKLNYWLNFDLTNAKGALNILEYALDDDTYSKYDFNAPYDTTNIYSKIDWYLSKTNYSHPIFKKDNCFNNCYYGYNKDFINAFSLLFNIASILRQIDYYTTILHNPSSYVLNFNPTSSWGVIMTNPYFLRLGQDTFSDSSMKHDKYYLLMINPGVKEIDLDNLKCFISFNDRKYSKNHSLLKIYNEIIESKNYECERMLVTIPSSMDYNEIEKIILFATNNARHVNFVCENMDTSVLIKRIIVIKELDALEQGLDFIKGNYYVCTDPFYYNNFFANTPDNKKLWHQYDYSSKYKFHRLVPWDLKSLIMYHIKENCPEFPKLKDNNFIPEEWYLLDNILQNYKLNAEDVKFLNIEKERIRKERLKECCPIYLKPLRVKIEEELLGSVISKGETNYSYENMLFYFNYYKMFSQYYIITKHDNLSEEEQLTRQKILKRIKDNLIEDLPF